MKYKLLYIDEEKPAWLEIENALCNSEFEHVFSFTPTFPQKNLGDMIDAIIENSYDVVVTDFLLNNNTGYMKYTVDYTGEDIVREYTKRCHLIPFFVLTAKAEEAASAVVDINYVYSKSMVTNPSQASDTIGFWERVYKQIETHKRLIHEAEERYQKILSKIDARICLSDDENSQFLHDDAFLEKIYGGIQRVISSQYKSQDYLDGLRESLNELSSIINKLKG